MAHGLLLVSSWSLGGLPDSLGGLLVFCDLQLIYRLVLVVSPKSLGGLLAVSCSSWSSWWCWRGGGGGGGGGLRLGRRGIHSWCSITVGGDWRPGLRV